MPDVDAVERGGKCARAVDAAVAAGQRQVNLAPLPCGTVSRAEFREQRWGADGAGPSM